MKAHHYFCVKFLVINWMIDVVVGGKSLHLRDQKNIHLS